MKRCPECRRDYFDDSLLYCLDDGSALLEGPATAGASDGPRTQVFPDAESPSASEAKTRHQLHTTADAGAGSARSFDKRWLLIPFGLALIVAAVGGYRYFTSPDTRQIESIAVMPFINDSGNADVDYLSDGMTEMLINSLSQVPNLKVKARSSVFRYKGKEIDPKKIAPELNVQAIVNGHLIQRGDQLSLNLELVDGATETIIWGNKYERKLADLVALQSEVARDVSAKLRNKISGASEKQVTKEYTSDPEAYQLYLKGIYHWNKRTGDELKQAISLFQQAIDKDPGFAKAYGGLAMAYEVYGANTASTKQEIGEMAIRAKAAAVKALEMDNDLPEAHAVIAERKIDDEWDFAGSEASYQKAIELNPNFASAHQWYSEVLSRVGRSDEALAEIKKAYEIDPFSRAVNQNLGLRLLEMHRNDEAQAQFEKLIQSEPDYPMAYGFLSGIYADKGEFEKSFEPACKAEVLLKIETTESCDKKIVEMRKAVKDGGPNGFWRYILGDEIKKYERGIGSPIAIAGVYAKLGESDKAFEWLEKGFTERSVDITYLKVDTSFDNVRSDPRFEAMLRRIGLPV